MFKIMLLAACFICLSALTSAANEPVAVFPLQELGEGRNDANLPLTRVLSENLAESGNTIIGLETIIKFMAHNRIRTVGQMESYNISQVRSSLGAAFILLGTVTQRKERPEPSLGLILNLIRTSDARTIWTYVGSLSTGDERRVLGIGEPQSTDELLPFLLDEIMAQWPWKIISEERQPKSINIDSVILEPKFVRPGDEVHCRVRLRDIWYGAQTPRVFFKVSDQLYPATTSTEGNTYEATWIAGEETGGFPVTLILEWPHYGLTQTALLSNYVIDATPPHFDFELHGTTLIEGMPVFNSQLMIIPRLLIRKPLSHWRITFYEENGLKVGDMGGTGNLPEAFTWTGQGSKNYGIAQNGIYEVVIDAWDLAGNIATASKLVELNRSQPQVDLTVDITDEGMVVDLGHEGKVPLAFWRMEMWDKEGKILTRTEGEKLPVKIEIDLEDPGPGQEIRGFLFYRDVLGKRVSRKVGDLLPKLRKQEEVTTEEKPSGISESWVNEF